MYVADDANNLLPQRIDKSVALSLKYLLTQSTDKKPPLSFNVLPPQSIDIVEVFVSYNNNEAQSTDVPLLLFRHAIFQ